MNADRRHLHLHQRIPAGPRCEFERTLKGEFCTENGEVRLDGLRLCGRHADRLLLQERIAYWRAILAHVELWTGEARGRGRDDVVRLLERERARSATALERTYEELHKSRDEDGEGGSGRRRLG